MKNETNESLQEIVDQSRKVESTVKTAGWTDVIRPALENRRDSLLTELLSEFEHEKMILIQQGAIAINNLLAFVDQILVDGDAARVEGRRRLTEHPVRDSDNLNTP